MVSSTTLRDCILPRHLMAALRAVLNSWPYDRTQDRRTDYLMQCSKKLEIADWVHTVTCIHLFETEETSNIAGCNVAADYLIPRSPPVFLLLLRADTDFQPIFVKPPPIILCFTTTFSKEYGYKRFLFWCEMKCACTLIWEQSNRDRAWQCRSASASLDKEYPCVVRSNIYWQYNRTSTSRNC